MSWTDEEIDKLFQDKANDLSFEFKPEYWQEFSEVLSTPDLGAMAGEFDEVDQLYQLSANELTFQYKDAYWQEVQGMLPRRRRPDFLWFGTAGLFLSALTLGTVLQLNRAASSPVIAENEVSEEILALQTVENQGQVNEPRYETYTAVESSLGNNYLANDADRINLDENGNEGQPIYAEVNPEHGLVTSGTNDPGHPTIELPLDLRSDINPPVADTKIEVNPEGSGDKGDRAVSPSEETNQIVHTTEAVNDLPTLPLNTDQASPELADFQGSDAIQDLRLPTRSIFYLELNGGLSQSLITPSESFSYSTGFGMGAQFQKGRFSLTTGVNANWSFHDDILLNRQAKVYGFGSDVYRYTLKYDHIYSLEAVLNLGYRFGRHQITAGVRPSFAFGSKVGVTLLEEEIETDRQTLYGHMEGLKRFGLKPMIGYSVDLPSDFTIGLNIGIQTMKSVDEDFIGGKNNFLPIDGQLYLRKGISFRRSPKVTSH